MRPRTLQTRFILAGSLLVAATVISSLWSGLTFARLSAVVDDTLRDNQAAIDLITEVASSLEREDDALLLFQSGSRAEAREHLAAERQRGDRALGQLEARYRRHAASNPSLIEPLKEAIARYRQAGDNLLADDGKAHGLDAYHRRVNPLLRKAVTRSDLLREMHFRAMEDAGIQARDEALRGTRLVALIGVGSILGGTVVAVWLARSVLTPVRQLAHSMEVIREGNFDHRVRQFTLDELGHLAAGFNRMAEALSEYRRSSLGELLTAKSTLESTLNALPDAVILFDPAGTIVTSNPQAHKILAALPNAPIRHFHDIPLGSNDWRAIESALEGRIVPTSKVDFQHTWNVTVEGRDRRFLLTVVPIPDFTPGKHGAVAVLDDVTQFARLDELRSELIGVASHELKSPLTALKMNLLMLSERARELTPGQNELVVAAVRGCDELGLTIEELLDVTRIEAGQLRLNLAVVELNSWLRQTSQSLRSRFEDANVRLEFIPCEQSVTVRADPIRLRSVLANLLENALKYSPEFASVTVELSSRQNAGVAGGQVARIAVTDRGPGVPGPYRERIFEKFFRVEHHTGSDSGNVHGTGIGLYLSREIIKAHQGEIVCETNEPDIGTTFAISLPTTG